MRSYKKPLKNVKQNIVKDSLTSAQHDHGIGLLGKTLLIINPVSQNGTGSKNGRDAYNILRNVYHQQVEMIYTQYNGHGAKIVKKACNFDTIIAVGGDGLVHEVLQGLMSLPKNARPKFGVIPVGSGNDFARSLNISFHCETAVNQLLNSYVTPCDIGCCNGEYFAQTMSFGIDAGIAIYSNQLRKKKSLRGFRLYFESSIHEINHNLKTYNYKATIDNKKIQGSCFMFAIQNGPTYGGGFKVTPKASINDGFLDVCYCVGNLTKTKSLYIFGRACMGNHVKLDEITMDRCKKLSISFDQSIPCQLDGEEHKADKFNVEIIPNSLRVFKFAK